MKRMSIYVLGLSLAVCVGYSQNDVRDISNVCFDAENWMSRLHDSVLIADLSIPGSHNSCSYNTSRSFSKCQTQSLDAQLKYGVRYLDLRFVYHNRTLVMYHGYDNLHITLEQCLETVKTFLDKHPSETILLRLQREKKKGKVTDEMYFNAIVAAFEKTGLPLIDTSDAPDMKLGDLRGKALVVEYNNMEQNKRTFPHVTGYSYWGYFTSADQIKTKWEDIMAKEVDNVDRRKINRINLYSSGGKKILGITIPNPESFTKLLIETKLDTIVDFISNNTYNYVIITDFEELYLKKPGEFYRLIIEKNFNSQP